MLFLRVYVKKRFNFGKTLDFGGDFCYNLYCIFIGIIT